MRPEDQLDALLDRRTSGAAPSAVDADLSRLLRAASRLGTFHDASPSEAFSAGLEQRLMARMSQTAGRAPAGAIARQPSAPSWRQPRLAWAAVAAVLILTVGLGTLTAQAAPGGPLYVVRQFAQTVVDHGAPTPTADSAALLAQLRADQASFHTAEASGDTAAALTALSKLHSDDQRAAQQFASIQDSTGRAKAQADLSAFHQSAEADLRASLATLSWQGRSQVTDVLRTWGDATLRVIDAKVKVGQSSGHDTQDTHGTTQPGMALVEVRGDGFAAGDSLLVNGQQYTDIVSLSPSALVAQVPASAVEAGSVVIGVQAGDGTVALAPNLNRDDQHAGDQTPTSGKGNGNNGDANTPGGTPESGNPSGK